METLEIILVENIDIIIKESHLNPNKNYLFLTTKAEIYQKLKSYINLNNNLSIKMIENIYKYSYVELINHLLNLDLDINDKKVTFRITGKLTKDTDIQKYDRWLKEKGKEIYELKRQITIRDKWLVDKDYWGKKKTEELIELKKQIEQSKKEINMYKNSKMVRLGNLLRRRGK